MYLKRITSIFSIIMIFMFTIGQSLLPIIASAQELSTTGFVDSFTIDKKTMKQGDKAKINVTFSDKSGNNMKSGDTLTLALPRELTGFEGTIPLNDEQGNNFGSCKVTAGKVVCTFNDMVEKLQNIRGHFYFTVQANGVGQTTNVETNLGTNLDKQTVTITSSSGGSTGSDPFVGKTGYIQPSKPDEVRWGLRINNKKEYLGRDIVVSDSLQEGQTLNKDSFRIIVNDREELTIKQFQDQRYGYVKFNDNNRSFQVVINWSMGSARSFNVSYASIITESGKSQESFKNDYKADYQILHKQPVSQSGTATVENITSGSGIQGDLPPKGTVRVVKHFEGDEEKVIPNVSFKLYKESGEQIGDVYKTNDKGIIEISDLQPGKYYVQEVSAPNYIDFDPQKKVSFEVKSNEANGVKLPISNKVKTTSIKGTKTWKGDKAKDRPGTIKVDLLQNGKIITTKEVSAASDWKYEFNNLAAYDSDGKEYKYEVREHPVEGYQSKVKGYDIVNTKIHDALQDEEVPGGWETIGELEGQQALENPNVTEEENNLENPTVEEKPTIEGQGEEKESEEKWETTEELEENSTPENPNVTEEENNLENPTVEEKPTIEGQGEEKESEEKWETTEELEENSTPENPNVTEEENNLENPTVEEKPTIEGQGEEKESEEKWETMEELEENSTPENPNVTEEENNLENPTVEEKPTIEGQGEEKESEEKWETTEELEKTPTPENPNVTEEENNLEKPTVEERPTIEGQGEEKESEEKWETTEELEKTSTPENPNVTEEENNLEKPKVEERPTIEGQGEETEPEEKWETTEELEKTPTPENPNVTEEENNLENPKVEEKPTIEGQGEETESEEKWETTKELERNSTPENPNVTKKEYNLHESKVKEQEKIEERKKTLPQTGGHVSYLPYIGGMLLVFALLILVINKRKWN